MESPGVPTSQWTSFVQRLICRHFFLRPDSPESLASRSWFCQGVSQGPKAVYFSEDSRYRLSLVPWRSGLLRCLAALSPVSLARCWSLAHAGPRGGFRICVWTSRRREKRIQEQCSTVSPPAVAAVKPAHTPCLVQFFLVNHAFYLARFL